VGQIGLLASLKPSWTNAKSKHHFLDSSVFGKENAPYLKPGMYADTSAKLDRNSICWVSIQKQEAEL
jgi:hypothetical protein